MTDITGTATLGDLISARARQHGDRTFLVFEDAEGSISRYSFNQLDTLSDRVAASLSQAGVRFDDKVVVHLRNCPEFLLAWFGLAKLGAVMIPSNTGNTFAELSYIVEFTGAVACITEPDFAALVQEVAAASPTLRHIWVARSAAAPDGTQAFAELLDAPIAGFARPTFDNDHLAEIIFTSGTTAAPKGVMTTHAQLVWTGEHTAATFRLTPDEVSLTSLPCFHVNAQSASVLSALSVGATLVLLERYSATRFWSQVRAHGANFLSLVPMMLRTLALQPHDPDERDHRVREICYAYHHLDGELEAFAERYGVQLLNGYGLTEALTVVCSAPIYGERRYPAIGLPTWSREVKLLDDAGMEVPQGEVGEICVRGVPGRTILKGYFRNPEETARTVVDGWLHTGDNGYADEAGYIYFFDRKKDIIKRAGENVSASEVERLLLSHPAVVECAVIAVPDPLRDEAVMAYVVCADGGVVEEAEVIAFCSRHLSKFKVPSFVEVCEALPKTSVGKVQKRTLRAQAMTLERVKMSQTLVARVAQ